MKNYSTTQLLTQEKPLLKQKSEDKFETVLFLTEGKSRKDEGGLRTKGYFKKSYDDKPLIGIITVVFNGEKYLEETIKSAISQTYDNVEYIIIDGGSTDGTLDIIKKYEDQIDYWVSEKDAGIYDAMNKGLWLAIGEYIGILNSDDHYLPDAIEASIQKIQETNSDYSFANVKYVNSDSMIRPIYPLEKNRVYQEMSYPHVSAFIKSNIYKTIGLFDTGFQIAGDHDMAVRIHLHGYKYCYIDKVIAELEMGGISSSVDSNKESLQVAIKNGKHKMLAYCTYVKQLIKVTIVKILPQDLLKLLYKIKGSRFQ